MPNPKQLAKALFLLSLSAAPCLATELLAVQDFEITPVTPTWGFSGPVVYNSGFSSNKAAPPNSAIGIGGSRAWETTSNSGGLVLNFDNLSLPTGTLGFVFQMRLAAMSLITNTGGPDDLDFVLVEYSTDNGVSYVPRIRVRGALANNSFWGYDATGIASAFWQPQSEVMFQPLESGLQTTFGYSLVELRFPAEITQLRMRITARSSSSSDTWLIDNLTLSTVSEEIFANGFED
jgi:hypothetical protein